MFRGIAFALLTTAGQPDRDAETLLRQARERLAKADGLEVRFEGARETEGVKNLTFKGFVKLSKSGRLLEAEMTASRPVGRADPPYRKVYEGDAVPKLAAEALNSVGRAGAFVPFFLLENWDDVKERKQPFVDARQLDQTAPRLGGKEKIGGREAQILEYTLKSKNGRLVIANRVWVDAVRHEPLKWSTTAMRGKLKVSATETFEKVDLGK
jgi:hypothetical protein